MSFNDFENNVIFEYWKTLKRINILNIPSNNFIKKPYLEKYIIDLSVIINNNDLIKNIAENIDNNISGEDVLLYITSNIELSTKERKKLESFLINYNDQEDQDDKDNKDDKDYKDNNDDKDDKDEHNELNNEKNKLYYKISIKIIEYQIKYFRFYQTIIELLFNSDKENNELYNFIYVFIKNNINNIRTYSKKNLHFLLFNNYLNELFNLYKDIFKLLVDNDFIDNEYNDKDIRNFFIQNIFKNWYLIYKKDVVDNKFEEKCKPYRYKINILSKILCLPNA